MMMMKLHLLLFIVYISTFVYSVEMNSRVRNKRILYGHEAKDKNRDAYQSFRYYVYLAKTPMGGIDEDGSKLPGWIAKFFHFRGPAARLDLLDCGGSLLTPKIVQTACHCLALYTRQSNADNFSYAWPLNVWEDRIYSYVGSNNVKTMYDMLIPRHYIVYNQCKAIMFHLQYNVMDFGLIFTKDSVDTKARKAAISYAPAYKAEDILNFYYETINKEFMCLVIGHGDWNVPHLVDFKPFVIEEASEHQRWGWRTAMNYMDCLSASYPPTDRRENEQIDIHFNYKEDSSWVCFQAFKKWKKWNFVFGSGDSGGPVSCNGVYFAVASMAVDWLSMGAPIVLTMFENAAEYRHKLLSFRDEFFHRPDDWRETTDFPYPKPSIPEYKPTPPPGIRPASHCSLMTINDHLLVLLSSTLLL